MQPLRPRIPQVGEEGIEPSYGPYKGPALTIELLAHDYVKAVTSAYLEPVSPCTGLAHPVCSFLVAGFGDLTFNLDSHAPGGTGNDPTGVFDVSGIQVG